MGNQSEDHGGTSDAQVHYDLGFAYAEMGLDVDAISELELGITKDPHHWRVREAKTLVHVLRERLARR